MLQRTLLAFRRGRKRPKFADFESRWRHEPPSLRPQQGGQQMFEALLLQKANRQAKDTISRSVTHFLKPGNNIGVALSQEDHAGNIEQSIHSSQQEILRNLQIPGTSTLEQQNDFELDRKMDEWTDQRKFNPVEWYRANAEDLSTISSGEKSETGNELARVDPLAPSESEDIRNISVFEEKYGCSMLKKWQDSSKMPKGALDFNKNLDMWAEMPKYTNDMYFLYIIVRRRNTYAVFFDIDGKCIHAPLSAGKVGLKNSDKGWRSEGSSATGNIVTSKYLDMVYPKLCQLEEAHSRHKTGVQKGRRPIQVVLRVMGWYNGRQGALKALNDRRDKYQVCYFEDITPVPRNGPRMPKVKRR